MDNPTVDGALIRQKFCWPYGKPVGLREWDGQDHPVTVNNAATGKLLRVETDPFTYDLEVEMSRHTGK